MNRATGICKSTPNLHVVAFKDTKSCLTVTCWFPRTLPGFKQTHNLFVFGRNIIHSWKRGAIKKYAYAPWFRWQWRALFKKRKDRRPELYNLLMVPSREQRCCGVEGIITSDRWHRKSLVEQSSSTIVRCSNTFNARVIGVTHALRRCESLFCSVGDES